MAPCLLLPFLPSKHFTFSAATTPLRSPLNHRYRISASLHQHNHPGKPKVFNLSDASEDIRRFDGAPQHLRYRKNNIIKGECFQKEKQLVVTGCHTKCPLIEPTFLKAIVIALGIFCFSTTLCGYAQASEATIKASNLGLKIASILRRTGWPDEAIVFLMAMLPVLELRGAIPVGYWMQLDPLKLSLLSILGNMVPVPFIVLYMEKLASFLSTRSPAAKKIVDAIFDSARRKAGPIQEFEWLGLMLFVAVPFPGTGAWSGAMIASILGMQYWDAISANFFGVVMAGVLVNLLVNLGFKYALMVGFGLFLVSTFMWSFLRAITQKNPQQ